MKKSILTLNLVLLSFITFGQAAGEGYRYSNNSPGIGAFFTIGFALLFFVLLFLVFRQVMLWYWKVDKIVKNQEEQNNLLRGIYNTLQENSQKDKKEQ